MIALIQISTIDQDYVLDPFPTFDKAKVLMREILADVKKLKVFCGSDNDFLNIRRDFEVLPVNCLDLQFLDKRLRGVAWNQNPKGLKELCLDYLSVNIPKGESNRDWRRRPLPAEMMKYAQADSYYCMAVFQEMKRKVIHINYKN